TIHIGTLDAMRASLALFCVLYVATGVLYTRLPRNEGAAVPVGLAHLSPESRPIVRKISWLFFIDAFGGGFVGSALLAYFFAQRFAVGAAQLAELLKNERPLDARSH